MRNGLVGEHKDGKDINIVVQSLFRFLFNKITDELQVELGGLEFQ